MIRAWQEMISLTFTMHSNSTLRCLSDPYKPIHDQIRWHRPVHKEQFPMLEAVRGELARVVRLFVKSYDSRHAVRSKVVVVVLRAVEGVAPVEAGAVVGAGECQHFARDYPV